MCVNSFQLLFTTVFFNGRDSYGFITYRYTCDAFAALENGYTLRRSNEPDFELYFCGRKQFCKSNYADLGRYFALCELKWNLVTHENLGFASFLFTADII